MSQEVIFDKTQNQQVQATNFLEAFEQQNTHKFFPLAQQKFQKKKSVFNVEILSKQSLTKLNWYFSQNKYLEQPVPKQQELGLEQFQQCWKLDFDEDDTKQNLLVNLLKMKAVKNDQTNFHFTRKVAAVHTVHSNTRHCQDNATTTSYEKLYDDENDMMNEFSHKTTKHNSGRRTRPTNHDSLGQQVMSVNKTIKKFKSGPKGHKSTGKAHSQVLSEKSSTSAESKMNDFSYNFTDQGGKKTNINKKMQFQINGEKKMSGTGGNRTGKGGNRHRISMRQKKKSQLLKMSDQFYA